jgi:hypothetical protein
MLGQAMSPTLLELIVACLLLWVAWQLGVRLAPLVFAAFISFWRNPAPPLDPDHRPAEKNITPRHPHAPSSPRK